MEPILYCDKCFHHFGLVKSGNALANTAHGLCGGTVKALKPNYVGIFLDDDSKKNLLLHVPPAHRNVHANHITLAFGRHMGSVYPLGHKVSIEVTSILQNERGQCVTVRRDFLKKWLSDKQDPHITISCAEGIKPVYSNDMLKDASIVRKEVCLRFSGILDYFPRTTEKT